MNVKEIREKLKLTQRGFADKLGFSINSVRNWEQGYFKPSLEAKNKINELVNKGE